MDELSRGIEVEAEHQSTYDFIAQSLQQTEQLPAPEEVYQKIAEDHLREFQNYYTALDEMESKLKQLKEENKMMSEKRLAREIEKVESEIKDKDNPIQENPGNARNPAVAVDSKNVPEDKDPVKKKLLKDVELMERTLNRRLESEKEPGVPKKDGTGPRGDSEECPFGKGQSVEEYLKGKKEFMHVTKR